MKTKKLQLKRVALFVLLTIAGMTNAFAQEFTVDGFKYEIENASNNTVTIKGYADGSNNAEGELVIPKQVTYNGITYSVKSISNQAFNGCTGLTSVTIPNSVTSIGENAFAYCKGLTSVTIPNSIKTIGWAAFWCCTGLTSVTIPNSVTELAGFGGCTGLTSVTIPNSVTKLSGFYDCTGLTSVTIPNSVTELYGFQNCTNLTTINIPNSVTKLSGFFGCTGLTSVTIPNSVKELSGFGGCTGLTLITIPNSVTKLSGFSGCTGLTSVTIPNSVTELSGVKGCTGLTSVTIPNSVIELSGFGGCTGLTSITIPNSVKSIGAYAFEGCAGLTSVTIPNSVKSIDIAFGKCTGLTSVTIPNSVTELSGFVDCTGLTSVTIPNSVEKIDEYAFSGCTGLTSITIPNSVKKIGFEAFSDCSGLTSVTIPNSVEKTEDFAFSGCTGLTSVTIPNSVIELSGFGGCTGLTSVTIPNSVKSIGDQAFEGCTGLTSIIIPNSVEQIGNYAFRDCKGLTSVTIDANTKVEEYAFDGCDNLKRPQDPQRWIDMGIRDKTGKTILWADADFVVFKDGSFGLADYGETGSKIGWGDITGVISGGNLSDYGGNNPPINISGNPRYDIVTSYFGEYYRLPTSDEFRSLIENCDIEYKTITKKITGRGGLPSWVQGEWMWHCSDIINGKVTNVSINLRIDGYLASVYTSKQEYWEGSYSYNDGVLNVWKLALIVDDKNKTLHDNKGYQFHKINNKTETSKTTGYVFKSRINGNTLFFVMPSSNSMLSTGNAVLSWRNPQEYDYWTATLYPEDRDCAIIFRQNNEGYGMMAIPRYSHCRVRPIKIER